jgi:hypothetical protein
MISIFTLFVNLKTSSFTKFKFYVSLTDMPEMTPPVDPSKSSKDWGKVHRVEKVEREKHEDYLEKKSEAKKPQESMIPLLWADVTSYLKKILQFFSSDKVKAQMQVTDLSRQLAVVVTHFNDQLKQLSQQDCSRDPDFVGKLTKAWHEMLSATSHAAALFKAKPAVIATIHALCKEIESHPPHADHTLGFYLKGETANWLPVPFMELLEQLHKQYQLRRQISPLGSWISSFEQVIAALNEVEPL